MPLVHLVGDPDTDGDRMLPGPVNRTVFVGNSPSAGGGAAWSFGVPDLLISDEIVREHLEASSVAINEGYTLDDLEVFDNAQGSFGGGNPITGQEGPIPVEGSPAASGGLNSARGQPADLASDEADGDEASSSPGVSAETEGRSRCQSSYLNFRSNTNPNITSELCSKATNFARAWGRPITIGSAYRPPEVNERVGGARNSYHTRGMAIDVGEIGSITDRNRFIELAARNGFNGIGVYWPDSEGAYFIHLDIRPEKYHWGPRGGSHASQYSEVKQILRRFGFPYCD